MFNKMRCWIMQTIQEMWQDLKVRLSMLLVLLPDLKAENNYLRAGKRFRRS